MEGNNNEKGVTSRTLLLEKQYVAAPQNSALQGSRRRYLDKDQWLKGALGWLRPNEKLISRYPISTTNG
jgi:hypothetical protein